MAESEHKKRKVTPTFPPARRDTAVVEELHGQKIADPYRWLEDPDAEETKAFVDAQNGFYSEATKDLEGLRSQIGARMKDLMDFPKFSCFSRHGGRLFFEYNTGLQQQAVVFVQAELGQEPEVLLDPNTFSDDGTVALRGKAYSKDGSLMSFGVSSAGSDWTTFKFLRIADKTQLPDVLEKVKFSGQSWLRNDGLFYNRYLSDDSKQDGTETVENLHQKLYYHKLGTPQSEDILVWELPEEPEWMAGAEVTFDQKYLLLYIRKGCKQEKLVWVVDLEATPIGEIKNKWTKVITNWDGAFEYVANDGPAFTFATTTGAPKKRIVRIPNFPDAEQGGKTDSWIEVIPERAEPLESAIPVADNCLLVEYIKDVKSVVGIYNLADGSHKCDIALPIGTCVGIGAERDLKEVFIKFTSFLEPGIVYRLADVSKPGEALETVKTTQLAGGLDLSGFETGQHFFESEDGTKIPMFVVHKKGMALDGANPTLLYGYGGFNISMMPQFSVSRLLWCHHFGGVLAVANIRGGGEYGLQWHAGGKLNNKQNCFTDFQCAAKFLVAKGYTTSNRLAIQGGSNGGLLVCACANQAPSLFAAVISQVGVLDILRFHKFTIGHAWTSDFGNPEVADDFKVALAYSPVHNIKAAPEDGAWQYPSMLLLTADHDDRVVPLHSLKFVAELQHTAGPSKGQTNPLLIKVDTKAGHGAGKPTSMVIEELGHVYSFVANATGATWRP